MVKVFVCIYVCICVCVCVHVLSVCVCVFVCVLLSSISKLKTCFVVFLWNPYKILFCGHSIALFVLDCLPFASKTYV